MRVEWSACPLVFHLKGPRIQFEAIYASAMCWTAGRRRRQAAVHLSQLPLANVLCYVPEEFASSEPGLFTSQEPQDLESQSPSVTNQLEREPIASHQGEGGGARACVGPVRPARVLSCLSSCPSELIVRGAQEPVGGLALRSC